MIKICKACKKKYLTLTGLRKFCYECAIKRDNEVCRQWYIKIGKLKRQIAGKARKLRESRIKGHIIKMKLQESLDIKDKIRA